MTDTLNNKREVIVAGHLCLDLIPQWDSAARRLEPGKLVKVGKPRFATGGTVANTGLSLHRLGIPVRLMGCVGDDFFGGMIRRLIEDFGVSTEELTTRSDAPTSYSIVLNQPETDRCIMHCPGVNDHFAVHELDTSSFGTACWIHVGYPPLMRRMVEDGGAALAHWLAGARRMGLLTSLDMAVPDSDSYTRTVDWSQFMERVLPHVDVFAPSLDDLSAMLPDTPPKESLQETPELLSQFALRLLGLGPALVVIKLGEHGLYASASSREADWRRLADVVPIQVNDWFNREGRARCFQVDVAGTVGAGDATVAGFIASMVRGLPLARTMEFAVAVGASCVEAPDAISGIRSSDEIEARIQGGWKHKQPATQRKES